MASVPLWHSGWLPVLFVLSSLSCGIALCVAFALLGRTADAFRRTMRLLLCIDGALIVIEGARVGAVAAVGMGRSAAYGALTPTDEAAQASLALLLSGAESLPFWGGLVTFVLIAPLPSMASPFSRWGVMLPPRLRLPAEPPALPLRPKRALLASAGCVLVGGACLRAVVVAAGMLPAISGPF